jgi:hypothetical protein
VSEQEWRDTLLRVEAYSVGDVVLILVDAGLATERVRVERADPFTLASPRLVASWYDGTAMHVRLERAGTGPDVVRFGTEGEGCGVVAYEIGERRKAEGEWDMHEFPTIPLRRIE